MLLLNLEVLLGSQNPGSFSLAFSANEELETSSLEGVLAARHLDFQLNLLAL